MNWLHKCIILLFELELFFVVGGNSSIVESHVMKPTNLSHANGSGTNKTSTDNCSISLTEFLIYFYLQPVICFCGFLLNLINVAIFRKPQFSGAAYAYMTAMSLADAITLISHMPSGLVRCAGFFVYCQHPTFKSFRTGLLYYNAYVLFPLGNISETASVWFTLVLSIERYLAMCHLGIVYQQRVSKSGTTQDSNSGSSTNSKTINSNNDATNTSKMDRQFWLREKLKPFKSLCACRTDFMQLMYSKISNSYICAKLTFKHSIVIITILSILLNLPLFFVQKVVRRAVPTQNDNKTQPGNNSSGLRYQAYSSMTYFGTSEFYRIFSWVRIVLIQGLPLVFLCIANFLLFRLIRVAGTRRKKVLVPKQLGSVRLKKYQSSLHKDNLRYPKYNGGSSSKWQAAQRKLTILLIVIVALFLAGQIPQAFAYVAIFEAFNKLFGTACTRWRCCPPYLIYRAVAHLLCLFTYAINFFVYLTLNKHFKNQVRSWCNYICPYTCNFCQRGSTDLLIKSTSHSALKDACVSNRNIISGNNGMRRTYDVTNRSNRLHLGEPPSEAVSAPVGHKFYWADEQHSGSDQRNRSTIDIHYSPYTERKCHQCTNYLKQPTLTGKQTSHSLPGFDDKTTSPLDDGQKWCDYMPINHQTSSGSHQCTYCHTEIQFGQCSKPYISRRFRTCYSNDSVLRNQILDHLHPDPDSFHSETLTVPGLTAPTHESLSNGLLNESDTDRFVHLSSSPIGNQVLDDKPLLWTSYQTDLHDDTCQDCKIDPERNYVPTFRPIVYRESDFDIISVDVSLENEETLPSTAV